ncbi:ribosomal protein S18-alanine N-acetyltransferase [Hydrogenothermus marinus]|uniref:[Ribosomal protein bS18]-alanine N-acetyltransferase n=1 Tax=Hydrogenothermus marinus TaxID=133270 RepID=A0A3M0C4F2_9AQUI|nr:ribosomal protein S18-alanine N-acetyltransferase [Hydrogenothermus marinus]RMA97822.1 ribosomal-protein-alanine N-acetyltransferase [Hydrogenothermus marinus]
MEKTERVNKISKHKILIKDFEDKYIEEVLNIIKENFDKPWNKYLLINKNRFSYKKVYLIKDKIVGFLDSNIIFDEAEINLIVVRKDFQGKKIGSFILENFINELKEKNKKTIFLEVDEKNKKAINLYKKFGFEEYSIRKNYYKNKSNAILMRKFL